VSNSRLREGGCVVSSFMIGAVLLGRLRSEQLHDLCCTAREAAQ